MIAIQGYQLLERIYESVNSSVYRGLRDTDDQPVIIKIFQQEYPSPQQLARYRQEYEITSTLNIEGVVQAYSLKHFQHTAGPLYDLAHIIH